jgi:hypothetical protein
MPKNKCINTRYHCTFEIDIWLFKIAVVEKDGWYEHGYYRYRYEAKQTVIESDIWVDFQMKLILLWTYWLVLIIKDRVNYLGIK